MRGDFMAGMKKFFGRCSHFKNFCVNFWLNSAFIVAKATLVWLLIACGAVGIFIYLMFCPDFFIMMMLLFIIIGLFLW